jgi:hypothetical protein
MWVVLAVSASRDAGIRGDADAHVEDRKELIKVFREIEASINAQSVDRMVTQMAPEATVTWLNGETSRGHEEIKGVLQQDGARRQADPRQVRDGGQAGAPAKFYGNGEVAVADGTTEDEFFPVSRGPFRLSSNWTATCAKIDGQWKVVALHLSSNVFTNPLLDEVKGLVWYAAAGALAGGFVLGWLMSRLRRRK